jgi:hypothetical protein
VRLLDSSGNDVPYLAHTAQFTSAHYDHHDFQIVRNEVVGKRTIVEVVRPHAAFVVDEIDMEIRNTHAYKRMTLTGSDDNEHWFLITSQALSIGDPGRSGTSTVQVVDLPRSDYARYRFTLDDSTSAPIQILRVGWDEVVRTQGTCEDDTLSTWAQRDTSGTTTIWIAAPHVMTIDWLSFDVTDTGLYHRTGALWRPVIRRTGRGKKERTWRDLELVRSLTLSSDGADLVDLQGLRTDSLLVVIENGDDRPLRIADIQVSQLQRSLLAHLEPGQHYRLTAGDPKARAPEYDIAHFGGKLGKPLAELAHGPLELSKASPVTRKPWLDPSVLWIWVALVVVIALVAGMALRMLRSPRTPA